MNNEKNPPHFNYIVSSPYNEKNNCILEDGNVLHHIENLDKFYEAFGYTSEMHKSSIDPEVYIWETFRKSGDTESDLCLQSRIISYLKSNSETFQKRYGNQYEQWLGRCVSTKLSDADECVRCFMHPSNKAFET